jgi:[1-hydroxy-2-(trimethylamino)ethyl]phosphonate dioxygenase
MSDAIDHLFALFEAHGEARYETVSQRAHALQCAFLAEREGAAPALITAALLHDVGHMLHKEGEAAALRGIDDKHELIAQKHLQRLFGPAVAEPAHLHVDAKRWLCATDPSYHAGLSPASQRSLALQGGAFTANDAAIFRELPYAEEAIRLRRWDDLAKVPGLATPPLEHFRPYLETAAL